jgi:hypothetical protein
MKSDEDSNLRSFGGTATKLSQNPLGIIALFIVLVYAFASLVVGLGKNLTEYASHILVWFLAMFPVMVLMAFTWLVSRHHTKLYAPKDYQNADDFIAALKLGVNDLKSIQPQLHDPGPSIEFPEAENLGKASLEIGEKSLTESPAAVILKRVNERERIYTDSRLMVLVHEVTPSSKPGFKYDITIYAKRHGINDDISDVISAEFFFGKSFGTQTFTGQRKGNVIGISTSAYGTFLCTCWITFSDGKTASIYRYIDFEMGDLVQKILQKTTAS